jgi:serpin B
MRVKLSFLIACLVLSGTARAAETAHPATADQAAVVDGNNAFAVDLYGQLRKQNGNVFFSPEGTSDQVPDARLLRLIV